MTTKHTPPGAGVLRKNWIQLWLIPLLVLTGITKTPAQIWRPVGPSEAGRPSAGTASYTSLAIDGSGTSYIAYLDAGNNNKATVKKFNGTNWVTVGTAGFSAGTASYISLAIGSSGTPYIAYRDEGNSSKATVKKFDGSTWVNVGTEGFSAGSASYTSLAIDGSGTPYIAYQDAGNSSKATVMKFNGSNWVTVGAAGFSAGTVSYTSLAIDGSGTPYVAYRDEGNSSKATVMKFNGTNWVTVGTAGFSAGTVTYTSLVIDGSGTPYIAYTDASNSSKATVMKFDGSSWVTVGTAGFSAGSITYTSIAIDGSGTPYVAYRDAGFGNIAMVKKFDGSSWVTVGTAGFSAGSANYASLAFDGSGTPYVAYQDGGNSSKATVKKFNGSSWVTVGTAGFSAGSVTYTSLAINGSGTPYVAYRDAGNSSKATVMKFNGSSWVTVGTAGFSAGSVDYTSLAIDGSGTPYVAYRDAGNSNKATVMKFDGNNWVTVGTAGFSAGTVIYTSLAIDGSGTPYIAYQDAGNSSKATVMKFNGTNWVTVGTAGFSAGTATYTSLAFDGSNTPYVAYQDAGNSSKATVKKFDGSTWVNVGTEGFSAGSASYNSLAFDGSGTPYLAYNAGGAFVRKFAHGTTTWAGEVSSEYNNQDNWSPAAVPSAADTALFPAGTPNAPTLSNTTATVARFTQYAGQTLTLNNSIIQVSGAFTNDGTITGSGKVSLNGTSAQTISGSGKLSNLEINNSQGISVGNTAADTLKLTGLLTLTSGTLTTNNKLVLKSTAADQAAMVGPIPASGAAISGNVIHERYLSAPANGSGGRSWRLLTTPLANNSIDNSIFYHWQNNGVPDGTGIELFSPSGTGGAGNGLTQGGASPSIRSYDAATNTYQNVTNTKTTMLFNGTRNNTFLVFVPGHYGSSNIYSGSGATNADATGALITGTQNYSFTAPGVSARFYLLGNPYACPIDFDKVYNNAGTQNIKRMFWVLDPKLSSIGAYATVTYNSGSGTYITSTGNQDQFIQTGQGLFVEAETPYVLSSISIEENDKETGEAQTPMFRTNGGSLEMFRIKLYKNINNNPTLLDGTVVAGHQNSSNAVDGEDGKKFGNFNENISIWKGNNTWLAVESRSLLDHNDTVSVAITNMQQTTYQLAFEPSNMNVPGLSATLIDYFTNTATPISLTSNTTYSFSVTGNSASQGADRFDVVFNNTTPLDLKFVNISAAKKEGNVVISWNVNEQEGITGYEVERSNDGKSFETIASIKAANETKYTSVDETPFSGNNYYRVKAIARGTRAVYSNIVRVNFSETVASLSSYPNPAKGNTLLLSTDNLAKGTYYINIFNTAGQKAATKQLNVEGGSATIHMNIENLAPGIYIMHLMDENGTQIAEQKMVRQ